MIFIKASAFNQINMICVLGAAPLSKSALYPNPNPGDAIGQASVHVAALGASVSPPGTATPIKVLSRRLATHDKEGSSPVLASSGRQLLRLFRPQVPFYTSARREPFSSSVFPSVSFTNFTTFTKSSKLARYEARCLFT